MSETYLLCLLLLPVAVLLAMLYLPRTYYENRNPHLRGEDYWYPFCRHEGPLYSRGPRPWRRMSRYIRSRESFARSDAGLETAVISCLREKSLPWRDVVVRAKKGEVRLYGLVPSEGSRRRVEEAAAACGGTGGVVSFLRVHDASALWGESSEEPASG